MRLTLAVGVQVTSVRRMLESGLLLDPVSFMQMSPRRPSSIVMPETVCMRIEIGFAVPGMKLLGEAVKWTSAPVSQIHRSEGVSEAIDRMFWGRRISTVFAV